MQKKRHHHYIWRYYLRPWSSDEKIACLREGAFFESNLMGIGQKRDFYKLKELSLEELKLVKEIAMSPSRKTLQKINIDLVRQFDYVFLLQKYIDAKGIDDKKAHDLLDVMIHNLEEDLHTHIEHSAIKYIDSILRENIQFYDTDEGCIDFTYFLSVQYWRTNQKRQSVVENVNKLTGINLENAWNILSHIFATNMGWVLFAERKVLKMVLLKNETEKELITGDQPVINTFADFSKNTPPAEDEFELYYPVSPKLAVLISDKEENKNIQLKMLSENEVIEYNKMIIENSHSQVYATSISVLEEYKSYA